MKIYSSEYAAYGMQMWIFNSSSIANPTSLIDAFNVNKKTLNHDPDFKLESKSPKHTQNGGKKQQNFTHTSKIVNSKSKPIDSAASNPRRINQAPNPLTQTNKNLNKKNIYIKKNHSKSARNQSYLQSNPHRAPNRLSRKKKQSIRPSEKV